MRQGYSISNAVSEGDVCVLRGSKIIRASRRNKASKIVGVWTRGRMNAIWTPTGDIVEVNAPAGVIVYGPAKAKVRTGWRA